MTRLTYALRGQAKPGIPEMKMELKEVDISLKLEQFSEEILCKINPKGKVNDHLLFINPQQCF